MRYWQRSIFVIFLLIFLNFSYSQEIKKVNATQLKELIDTTNHLLIINFWASWCQPCVHEIPWFEKNVKFKKDSGMNIELILVSMDLKEDYPENLAAFAKRHGYTSRIFYFDEIDAEKYSPVLNLKWDGAVPASLFVSRRKNYRRFYTEQLTEPRFKIALNEMLK